MKPKMILTDLDKTLFRSDGSVSERTKRVLKRCQELGILVVIATARYWIGAKRYIDEIQPDYEITTDGTLIHRRGEQIYSRCLDADSADRIIRDLMEYSPQTEISVAVGRQVFWNSDHIAESGKLHKAVYHDFRNPLSLAANKIVAELADRDTAVDIAHRNRCRLQCYRGENWYAFLPEKSGKVEAIMELAESLHIALDHIVSFGDDANDVEMLEICGTGVAVSNAVKEARKAADCITLSNDEDGVADWIEKNVDHVWDGN
ncbi:MAG: Cof-type HAD-IIB family hydrolase [Acetatifactor sp.]